MNLPRHTKKYLTETQCECTHKIWFEVTILYTCVAIRNRMQSSLHYILIVQIAIKLTPLCVIFQFYFYMKKFQNYIQNFLCSEQKKRTKW